MDSSGFWGGGVAGLAVALIVGFTQRTWQSWMGSALRAVLARGSANVSGDYTGEYWELGDEDDHVQPDTAYSPRRAPDGTETIELQQRERRIEGRIIREVAGGADRSTFTGESADRHITGTYDSIDSRNPERGSFRLKISNGGSTLRGGYLWYNTSEGKETIDFGRYVWKRKT